MTSRLRLNIRNFCYEDLHRADRLPRLDETFATHLAGTDPSLAAAFADYRREGLADARAESALLIDVARVLETFLAGVFGVEGACEALRARTGDDVSTQAFKERFAKRHAAPDDGMAPEAYRQLDARLDALLDAGQGADRELAVARLWQKASNANDEPVMDLLAQWVKAATGTREGRAATHGWSSLRFPKRRDYAALVPLQTASAGGIARLHGLPEARRRRDGFDLTDARCDHREAIDQVNYCKYCHTHEGDTCSKGFRPKGSDEPRTNALGVPLGGCPLHERISEANVLAKDGFFLAALAMMMIDNPLLPATGHRICNDCMTSCIYQKHEPVNVPQIETRILNDVLELPWGYEIYYCLTRWNPLNRERPYAKPYNGINVLCVGAGPAGFNLTYHLLQSGFGVVAIDGLKIEPLPEAWVGSEQEPPQPVERIDALRESLDTRTMTGFGGVAEYGITVRWDKNFLRIIYLTLSRNRCFRIYGGIRFGGTMAVDDAWDLGFDHIALATGAGKPTIVPMRNGLARGIRQAADFLMALQLTGAAKRSSLANLQVRLPALVIGGGLTAIDTATEVQAYYIRQVEKVLARCEQLSSEIVGAAMTPSERGILDEFVEHGRAVRAERERAAQAGESPDFTPLLHSWGGVTVAYRRRLTESPAYLRNHEEIEKALEEGIFYVERVSPVEALVDGNGHVSGMRFERVLEGDRPANAEDTTATMPARSIFMAAGSIPNTSYEREHPGTFEMQGRYYRAAPAATGDAVKCSGDGFFTSYRQGDRRISYFGDNHPGYSGSVVRAMASGRDGAKAIAQLFRCRMDCAGAGSGDVLEHRWRLFASTLDDRLKAHVVAVHRLGAGLVNITVRAPQATKNWRPGQVYRLQNFESETQHCDGTPLHMEGMAVDGVHVDKGRGEVQLLINEVGASSRIAGRLRPGDPVILMGPTGTGLPEPSNGTVTVMGGHGALTSAIDGGAAWRDAGNRVVVIGHLPSLGRMQALAPLVEAAADEIVWVLDDGPVCTDIRPQDRCITGGMEAFFDRCKTDPHGIGKWLSETDDLIVSDRPEEMQRIAAALKSEFSHAVRPTLRSTAVVTSPMQCMLKEVCAQCVCQHQGTGDDGPSTVVFTCFNQHQPLFRVDFENLRSRQNQNRVQEKISSLWLTHVLDRCNSWRDGHVEVVGD